MKYPRIVVAIQVLFFVSCVVEERTDTRITIDPNTFDINETDSQYNEMAIRIASFPADWEARIWVGDYHFFRMKNPKDALRWYEEAAAVNPKPAVAWFKVGVANAVLENKDAAFHAFERTVECDPGYAEAYLNLSRIYEERKEFDRAAECRKKYFENFRKPGIAP